ncbi:sortase-dependent protein [Streptomyces sp. NPDC003011]
MRRTILSAAALACTAVLAGTTPAFADDPTPVPSDLATASTPSPTAEPSLAPSPGDGQVSAVPEGAPDTGVAASRSSGSDEGLIGAGAGAVLVAGGAALFVVRRRRAATGA